MRKLMFTTLITLFFTAYSYGETMEAKIRLSFDGGEVIISLHDTPAAKQLISQLPLTLEFKDYVRKEKISYLPRKLNLEKTTAGDEGDFAYFAPWGNLAVFYNSVPKGGGGLYILGDIETGKEKLAAMNVDFTATLEVVP